MAKFSIMYSERAYLTRDVALPISSGILDIMLNDTSNAFNEVSLMSEISGARSKCHIVTNLDTN